MFKYVRKIINKIKFKMGKSKIEIDKEYRVIPTPSGLCSSNWNLERVKSGTKFIVRVDSCYDRDKYNIITVSENGVKVCGGVSGWLYPWEMVPLSYTTEVFKSEIVENLGKIEALENENKILTDKISFIDEYGIDSFNEEEFKAYLVLKELGIDDLGKAKNIIKILGK